jgi:hypothetical protein
MGNIKYQEIIEGNLKAEKCTGDFGGPNMWNLCVRTNHGPHTWWESVQWMDVNKIQLFFKTQLPRYKEVSKQSEYELM